MTTKIPIKRLSFGIALVSMLSLGTAEVATHAAGGDPYGIDQSGKAKGKGNDSDQKAHAKPAKDKAHKDKAHKDKAHGQTGAADTTQVVVVDRDGHHRVIREYATRGTLPPGLAKREVLPPGLRQQLRETGELPPGLLRHLTPVPQIIGSQLPAVPVYYTRYFAGRDLIVVDTRNDRIVLLIRDVLQ